MTNIFLKNLKEHNQLFNKLECCSDQIIKAIDLCATAIRKGNKLLLCGNGGSAADSQHIAAEFVGRLVHDRPPIPALALSTDTSILTCIGNDYGFDHIFSRQVSAIGAGGDVLIAISTSGNSKNVVNAVKTAGSMGLKTLGLLGHGGGKLKSLCDIAIIVPSETTARIQEAHILIGHSICGGVEESLGLCADRLQ